MLLDERPLFAGTPPHPVMKKLSADRDQQDEHSRSNEIMLAEEMVDRKTSQSNEAYGEKKMNFVLF